MHPGADPGFSEEGVRIRSRSIGMGSIIVSLKQGAWVAQLPRSYRVFISKIPMCFKLNL